MGDLEFTALRKKVNNFRTVKEGNLIQLKGILQQILDGKNAAEMRETATAAMKNAELFTASLIANTPSAQEAIIGSEGTRGAAG